MRGKRPTCPVDTRHAGLQSAPTKTTRSPSERRHRRCIRRAPTAPNCCRRATCRGAGPAAPQGRIALLHAVAHIELNAVDLHWDIIARFTDTPMPLGFYDDWVKAADEESKHFNLVCDCLEATGSHYGALPAHAGMWRAAEDTARRSDGPAGGGADGAGGARARRDARA